MSNTEPKAGRTIPGMGRPKKTDRHKTQRINVGLPEPWHAVARKLAAKRQQPVTYTLIALLLAEAERQGIADLPPPPWDESTTEGG
jgi:hypothetical protein